MAMGRLFIAALNNRKQCHQHHGISSKISKNQKIVYISPSKALCDERYKDWTRRLAAIDSSIDCALVTGDSGSDSFRVVASAHVILTTPEKWDSISPKKASHVMSQHMVPFQSMKLIIELPFNADCRSILEMLSNMEGIHYPVGKFEKVRHLY